MIALFAGLSHYANGQFTGTMVFNSMGKERHFKVHSSGEGYRYDFDESGQKGAVIVKNGSAEVIMLMPPSPR